MSQSEKYHAALHEFSKQHACELKFERNEFTLIIKPEQLLTLLDELIQQPQFGFDQLIDIAGVDYLEFAKTEWKTEKASASGFSRGVANNTFGRFKFDNNPISSDMQEPRFAVVYHLLSIANNQRLRVKVFCQDNDMPQVKSVCSLWSSANWYEREAFDLFGIIFDGHPDMRRILTDYGFVGHPLRKDFPLVGHVEVRFDPSKKRVIYQPVTIEPRVLVPKVIREDSRYIDNTDVQPKES